LSKNTVQGFGNQKLFFCLFIVEMSLIIWDIVCAYKSWAVLTLQAGFIRTEVDPIQILRWYQSLSKIHWATRYEPGLAAVTAFTALGNVYFEW